MTSPVIMRTTLGLIFREIEPPADYLELCRLEQQLALTKCPELRNICLNKIVKLYALVENYRLELCQLCQNKITLTAAIQEEEKLRPQYYYFHYCPSHWLEVIDQAGKKKIRFCEGECDPVEVLLRPPNSSLLCGQATLPGDYYCEYHKELYRK